VLVSKLRVLVSELRDHADKQFDLLFETIDGFEFRSCDCCRFCHPRESLSRNEVVRWCHEDGEDSRHGREDYGPRRTRGDYRHAEHKDRQG
jgi:hypothetical protein